MKKYFTFLLVPGLLFSSITSAQIGWTELNGVGIAQPASQIPHNMGSTNGFRIGNSGYLGTGYFDHGFSDYPTNDFFSFDIFSNLWQPVSYLPGAGRGHAVAFEINSKGYICFGQDDTTTLIDAWEYDATSDAWTQKTDFLGLPRRDPVYFTNNGKGYIAGGYKYTNGVFPYYHDCWEFDPVANTWNQKSDFPLTDVALGATFTINQYSYVTSFFSAGSTHNTTYRYDQIADSWDTVATYPETQARFGFSINGLGYVVNNLQLFQYDPVLNTWNARAGLPYPAYDRFAFTHNNLAYVANGDGDVLEYNPASDSWLHKYKSPSSYQEPFSHAILIGDTAYSGMWKYDFNTDFWRVDSALADANWLFSIGGLGYAYVYPYPAPGSFQVYDPIAQAWTLLPPNSLKTAWIYFTLNGKGYFGMGTDSLCPDGNSFYEYDPSLSQWTRKADFPGTCRYSCASFSLLNKGYVAGGGIQLSDTLTEFWQYDPSIDSWSQKANTPESCIDCIGIETNSKAYYGFGRQYYDPSPDYPRFNFYDPSTDSWSPNLNRPLGGHGAIGFSKGGKLYLGRDAIYYSHPYSDQRYNFWVYDEFSGVEENKIREISIYPNPASSTVFINCNSLISSLKIFDPIGNELFTQSLSTNKSEIDVHSLASGIYFLQLQSNKGSVVKKFIKN